MRWLIAPFLAVVLVPTARAAEDIVRHAGLEIGGSGVKVTIVDVRPDGIINRVFSKSQKTALTTLEDGRFKDAAIADTAKAMGDFLDVCKRLYRVPIERIHVVGSSGVPKASNADALLAAVKKATGKELVFIDERTEVDLGIEGILPKKERDRAVSLDIGSGNTKGGYKLPDGSLVYVAIPLGTATFTQRLLDEAKASGKSIGEVAGKLREAELVAPLRKGAKGMPELAKRSHVYLSGGMLWAMTTLMKPEAVDRGYVPFKSDDIAAFAALVRKNGGKLPTIDLDRIDDPARRDRARKELAAVLKAFSPENLLAGAELLESLVVAFDLKGKTLIFPRNAAFGWLTAYIARSR